GCPTPAAPRARAPRANNWALSSVCSLLHLLKKGSLRQTRGGSIPERAALGPCIVLLDEAETIAADRHKMSLETNPVDVHRATDAALSGIDMLVRKHRNVLLIATTNFPQALDRAFLSRADAIEDIGLPSGEARREIIDDALAALAREWPDMRRLKDSTTQFVAASKGLDGRRLRKAVTFAAAATMETAKDPGRVTAAQVLAALKSAASDGAGQ
ncbi:MAG: AAA family ATPase, partial [Solimonas sp.]